MRSSTGSRMLRASSGSRSASSSIEPLRSANRTVTCLRSPSRAAREVRMRSARCLGVYASGAAGLGAGAVGTSTGVPHSMQKRSCAVSPVPEVYNLGTANHVELWFRHDIESVGTRSGGRLKSTIKIIGTANFEGLQLDAQDPCRLL